MEYTIQKIPFTDDMYRVSVPDDSKYAGFIEEDEIRRSYGDTIITKRRYFLFLIPAQSSEQTTKSEVSE